VRGGDALSCRVDKWMLCERNPHHIIKTPLDGRPSALRDGLRRHTRANQSKCGIAQNERRQQTPEFHDLLRNSEGPPDATTCTPGIGAGLNGVGCRFRAMRDETGAERS
jgi:hypothetical protein